MMMRKDLVQLLCTTRAVAGGAKFDSYLVTIKRKVMKHFDLVSCCFLSCTRPVYTVGPGKFWDMPPPTRSDNLYC